MSNIDNLVDILFNPNVTLKNFDIFVGDGQFTEEELLTEICSALIQERNGLANCSNHFDDSAHKINVYKFLESL